MKRTYPILIIIFGVAAVHADILSNLSPFLSSSRPDYDYAMMNSDASAANPRLAPFSPADSDLGVQQILQAYNGLPPIEFRFETSYNHTDNAPDNLPFQDTASLFWASQLDVNWMPRIANGWFLEIGLSAGWFQFENSSATDFENFEGHIGAVKSIPELDDLIFFVRYENQRITNGSFSDDSYSADRIRVGLRKDLILAPRYQLSAGVDSSFDLSANNADFERNQYTADLRFTYWFADKLSTSLSYTGSMWDFRDKGREDINQILGLELTWTPCDCLSIFTNVYFIDHNSNTAFSFDDYESLQSGIGFGVTYSF